MFDITKLALKIPNFLTHQECDELINEFEQRKEEFLTEGSYNVNKNRYQENTFKVVPLIPSTKNFNLVKKKTKKAINLYIDYLDQPKYFFTTLLKQKMKFSHAYRIMKYEKGDEIHPHSDHDPGTYGSISFNLNEDYEGGEFKFFNGNYTVPLGKGDALIFPADYFWVHEVTPVTKGSRYSLNSFLQMYPMDVRHAWVNEGNKMNKKYINFIEEKNLLGPYNDLSI